MDEVPPSDRDDVFSIDRHPDPVITYTVTDGEPRIRAANEAFESEVGYVSPGTPVRTLVKQAEIKLSETSRAFLDFLEGDDILLENVSMADTDYCARILPPTGQTPGYIFLIGTDVLDGDASVIFASAGREQSEGDTNDSERSKDSRDQADRFDVDRVTSVLSHDLRNPLDVAKARLRAARETGADEHFDHVEKAHERMERIIEDVLTLSGGPEYIEPKDTVALRAVVESAWETVETESATLTIADELPTTVADSDRIERLFENLFRNAVEHGDDPAVTVGSLDGTVTGFYVADDGPGIQSESQSAIFEPGYSSHDHGTGLGLSIVRQIAESHGWTVEAKEGDSGARFEVYGMEPGS